MTLPLVTINGTAAYLTRYSLPWWLQQHIQCVCVNLTLPSGGVFGTGSGAIWLDNVQCTGEEEGVWQCSHEGWGVHNCNHSEDAGVRCAGECVCHRVQNRLLLK